MLAISTSTDAAAVPTAYPSPLTPAPASCDPATLFAPLRTDPMLSGTPAAFTAGNFLQFDTPDSAALARAAAGDAILQQYPALFASAVGAAAAVSPCTAAITQAAVAAMSSSASSSGASDSDKSPAMLPTPTPVSAAAALDLTLPPEFFLPNFHEYDRHQYDLAKNPELRRQSRVNSLATSLLTAKHGALDNDNEDAPDADMDADNGAAALSIPPQLLAAAAAAASSLDPSHQAEVRRQIHIQSEQKRRAQIKDGFDDLRRQLPNCVSKKMSKAVILSRTTVYLQQLKDHALQLQRECERLAEENAKLRNALGQTAATAATAGAADNANATSIFPM